MANESDTFVLVRFGKKSGKIDTVLESLGNAMLRMWALQNTTKTKGCLVFSKSTGNVVFHSEGTNTGFPNVKDSNLGNISEYCPGLLEAVQVGLVM